MLGVEQEIPFEDLTSDDVRRKLGDITFAAATSSASTQAGSGLGRQRHERSVIYVHKFTSQARIDAIAGCGAEVRVVDETYDDAVRQADADARANGWQVISDLTSWEGYEDIPRWVMQGYSTMLSEAR